MALSADRFPDGAEEQKDTQTPNEHSDQQHHLTETTQLVGHPEIQANRGERGDAGEQHLQEGERFLAVEVAPQAEQQSHPQNEQQRSDGDAHGPQHHFVGDLPVADHHGIAAQQRRAGRRHQRRDGCGLDPAAGPAGTGTDEHQRHQQQRPRVGDVLQGERNGGEACGASGDRFEQSGHPSFGPGHSDEHFPPIEPFGHRQPQGAEGDQQQGGSQHQPGMKAGTPSSPAEPESDQVTGDPPAQSSHHDQQHHNGVDDRVRVITLQAVGPESEAGVVVSRDAVEHRCPDPLPPIRDVAETEAVKHHRTDQDHRGCGQGDGSEGGAHTADAKFIEGPPPVKTASQSGSLHDEPLQKGGDRHQSQPSGQNHDGQNQLPETGQVRADVDDRQPRDGDGGGGREQRFPEADTFVGTERCAQHQGPEQDHQQACHHRELRNGEPAMPALAAFEGLAEGHAVRLEDSTSVDQVGP